MGFIFYDPDAQRHAELVARLDAQQVEIEKLRSKLDTAVAMIALFAREAGVDAKEVLREAAEWL